MSANRAVAKVTPMTAQHPPRDPDLLQLLDQLYRPMPDRVLVAGLSQLTARMASPQFRRTVGVAG